MKVKWGLALVITVAVLLAAVIGVRIWCTSPGIRVLGNEIHVNLSQKCFLIDEQSGEIVDETTVTVKGGADRNDSTLFDGELKILGYQNSETGKITALKAVETAEDGCRIITYLENCTHREKDENGITKDVEHFCDYSYTYYLYPDAPEKTVVLIESFSKNQPVYAVCADSEQAALDRYEEFLEYRP